jgi:shikimate kinase
MNLILCGFKSSGKSHLGKLLAERCKMPFIDTDKLIENRFFRSCHSLMLQVKEPTFRTLEKDVIVSLEGTQDSVIAIGGGALLNPLSAQFLSALGKLIYLKVEKEALRKRLLTPPLPAFFDENDPEGSFMRMYEEREPLYSSLSQQKVSVENGSEKEILDQLERFASGQ